MFQRPEVEEYQKEDYLNEWIEAERDLVINAFTNLEWFLSTQKNSTVDENVSDPIIKPQDD